MREAGATAAQELAFTMADAIAYVEAAVARGLDVDAFAGRLSFFFAAWSELFEEVAKFRAARRLWARIMKERFGAADPRSMMCRFHVQTAGSSLTAQSIDNNVVRTTVQALAAVLGGAQSLHTNSRDEALALPTAEAARLALRTQQILAHESGVTETPDPLAGSYYVETLTNELEAARPRPTSTRSTRWAGRWPRSRAASSSARSRSRPTGSSGRSRAGDQVVVGVNAFRDEERRTPPTLRIDPEGERRQVEARRPGARRARPGRLGRGPAPGGRGRPGPAEPHAGAHRGGQGLRDGRRDLERPPRRVGRAPGAGDRVTVPVGGDEMTPAAVPAHIRGVGRVHHVAVVVRAMDAALDFYRDTLGLAPGPVVPIPADRVRIAFLPVGEVKIELVEPTDDTTGVARFLASRGEGFHHVCFEVPDISATLTRLAIDGVELIDTRAAAGRRGPGRLPPPEELPRRAGRAHRGARRAGLGLALPARVPRPRGVGSGSRHRTGRGDQAGLLPVAGLPQQAPGSPSATRRRGCRPPRAPRSSRPPCPGRPR